MAHIWISHVTHMDESCHTYEWVMSHIWMSHVTQVDESSHTYEWVIPTAYCMWSIISSFSNRYLADRSSHVTHMDESCHKYVWVMSHMWMSHVTHMNESPTAYCIWSVISPFSNLNRGSSSLGFFCHVPLKRDQQDWDQRLRSCSSLGLFCHVPLKRDQRDWEWRLRLNDTPNAIGCTPRIEWVILRKL